MLDDFLKQRTGLTTDELARAFELVSKLGLTTVGLAYVLGLVIVNLYLRRFGFFSAGLLRVEYVMAGALWLALFGLGYILDDVLGRRQVAIGKYFWQQSKRRKAIARFVAATVVPFLACLFIVTKLFDGFSFRSLRDWSGVLYIFATPAIFLNFADLLKSAWQRYRETETVPETKLPVFTVAAQGALLLTFLSYYAQIAYPRIQSTYGGGSPSMVRITADSAVTDVLRRAVGKTQPSETFDLIADAGDWLVLTPHEPVHEWPSDSRSAIRVRRDDIIAVVSIERPSLLRATSP